MINKENFLTTFCTIFDDTPAESISFSTKFKDLDEWSSLIVLTLIVTIEQNLSILITAKQIDSSTTVEDLFNQTTLSLKCLAEEKF